MAKDIKLVFWGTPAFAVPSLSTLVEAGYNIVGVVTQPDKATGRKKVLTPPPIKVIASYHNIPVFQPHNLKDDSFLATFKSLELDICVIVAYGKIIPKAYLNIPRLGFVNIHPSLLPKYRGPSPIQSAIMSGENETGVCLMLVDEQMDHGAILAKREFTITHLQFTKEVEVQLAQLGAELLVETLPKYIAGKIQSTTQDDSEATYTKIITRNDGQIDWSWPDEKIYNLIRALSEEPGTWTTYKGKTLKIKKAHLKDGQLILDSVQLEGKNEISFAEFIHGHRDFKMSDLG